MSPAPTITGEEQSTCECGAGATAAISDVNLAHELTAQLQALVLPLLPSDDGRSELAGRLFREALRCSASALSRLQAAAAGGGAGSSVDGSVDRAVDQRSSSTCCSGEKRKSSGRDREETPDSHKRRRKNSHCSVVTTVPYEDGYQWRKYGQKNISGDKYPRSYFRCTYSKEERCPATKTVQQAEDDESFPPKFYVNYIMEHTCQPPVAASGHLPAAGTGTSTAAEYSVHGAKDSSDNSWESGRSTVNGADHKQYCDHTSTDHPSVDAEDDDDGIHILHPGHGQEIGDHDPATAAKIEKPTTVTVAAAEYDLDMPWAKILDSLEASSQT